MSYDTVLRFRIDRKHLTIAGRYRSSNTFDEHDRREVYNYAKQYNSIDEFMQAVFDYADDALNGSLRFSASSTMSKRLSWLKQQHKLQFAYPDKAQSDNPADAWYRDWYRVTRDVPTFKVLTGQIVVSPNAYIISNNSGIGVRETSRQVKLVTNRLTRFQNLDAAQQKLHQLDEWDWVKQYNLAIQAIN